MPTAAAHITVYDVMPVVEEDVRAAPVRNSLAWPDHDHVASDAVRQVIPPDWPRSAPRTASGAQVLGVRLMV